MARGSGARASAPAIQLRGPAYAAVAGLTVAAARPTSLSAPYTASHGQLRAARHEKIGLQLQKPRRPRRRPSFECVCNVERTDQSAGEGSQSSSGRRTFIGVSMTQLTGVIASASAAHGGTVREYDVDPSGQFRTLPSGLMVKDFNEGSGADIKAGDVVRVRGTGRLVNRDGYVFWRTSELEEGYYEVDTGEAGVIAGLREGLVGMRAGGVRRVIVPPGPLTYAEGVEQPYPSSFQGERLLRSVLDNGYRDCTISFDLQVVRVRP